MYQSKRKRRASLEEKNTGMTSVGDNGLTHEYESPKSLTEDPVPHGIGRCQLKLFGDGI